jgi:hypothetical protein
MPITFNTQCIFTVAVMLKALISASWIIVINEDLSTYMKFNIDKLLKSLSSFPNKRFQHRPGAGGSCV